MAFIKLQSNDNVVIEVGAYSSPNLLDWCCSATPSVVEEVLMKDDDVERQVAERSMLLKHILIDVPDALNDAIPLDKVCPNWLPGMFVILIAACR